MANTLATYTTMVQAEVDDTSAGAKVVVQNAIKRTYMEVLRRVGKYLIGSVTEELSATAGDRTFTPTNFTEIYSVHFKTDGDYTELKEITQEEYLAKNVNADNGTPTGYFINGLNIETDIPCEAGTLRVEYLAVPPLVNGSSLIPDRYNNVVVLGACYQFFAYEKGAEAENYYAWYIGALRDMEGELATRIKQPKVKLYGR